jgi:hypothetical protein
MHTSLGQRDVTDYSNIRPPFVLRHRQRVGVRRMIDCVTSCLYHVCCRNAAINSDGPHEPLGGVIDGDKTIAVGALFLFPDHLL